MSAAGRTPVFAWWRAGRRSARPAADHPSRARRLAAPVRRPRAGPGDGRAGALVRGLAMRGVGQPLLLVVRPAAAGRRGLQLRRHAAVRTDRVAGPRAAARPEGAGRPHRGRAHHALRRARRAAPQDGSGGESDQLSAPDLRAGRRRLGDGPGDGRRRGRGLRGARRRVEGPAPPRQGGQPEQRADADRWRVRPRAGCGPGPQGRDPGSRAGLLRRPEGGVRADAAVLLERPPERPPGLPGAALLRADPAGQGRLERGLLLRLQRGAAPRCPAQPGRGHLRAHAHRRHPERPARRRPRAHPRRPARSRRRRRAGGRRARRAPSRWPPSPRSSATSRPTSGPTTATSGRSGSWPAASGPHWARSRR